MSRNPAFAAPPAPIEQRAAALEAALVKPLAKLGGDVAQHLEQTLHLTDDVWLPERGAKVVARFWTDPAFAQRLRENGVAAVAELGIDMPKHHRHLKALENTPTVHNVICCTLCSCTAFTVIGLPPDWYKDLEYRARVVRQSRTVLAEMGLQLPPDVEVRVWDTTADTRYMVIPQRPQGTTALTEAELARLVSKDMMIGVAR